MAIVTATEIKYVENSFDDVNKFGWEIDVDSILWEVFENESGNDINYCA